MNLVGKIFVVLILVMSVLFMGFAVAVYSTHKEWNKVAQDLTKKLEAKNAQYNALEADRAALDEQVAKEKTFREQQIAKLQTERDELQREYARLVADQAQLVQRERQAVAVMEAAQNTLAAMRTEVGQLRDEVRTTRANRDEQVVQVAKLTDDLNQRIGDLDRLRAEQVTLADQIAQLQRRADRLGVNLNNVSLDALPPRVDGIVTGTGREGLVEVSVGADDGLATGNTMEVYRGSRYLGRIQLINVAADRSVARILPEFRKGTIAKDDRVATRLN